MTAPDTAATYGVTSMIAPLRRVLVRRPATAGDWADAAWRTPDPVGWWRGARAEPRLLDREDIAAIEGEFIRNGRHHLLEG